MSTEVINYFERFKKGDSTVPESKVLLPIAKTLDDTVDSVVKDFIDKLRDSEEHKRRVKVLKERPRCAGAFSCDKVIFGDVNAFEQMVAVRDWLSDTKIKKVHTFFLHSSVGDRDDYVPAKANKFPNVDATLMHVFLGSSRGSHKAPKYENWAEEDPKDDGCQEIFIEPLEKLEIVRQPSFSAATVIKGNAFALDHIDSEWRYGSKYACVEDKRQSQTSRKKQMSSGLNACALVDMLADTSDPMAKEDDLCPLVQYEDFTDTGYDDDLEIQVSPGMVLEAAKRAIVDKNIDELTHVVENLVITNLGAPKDTPSLAEYMVSKLQINSKKI